MGNPVWHGRISLQTQSGLRYSSRLKPSSSRRLQTRDDTPTPLEDTKTDFANRVLVGLSAFRAACV
ncbi:MAG: hypothetical protein H7095_08620 [Pseudopedobacter sp.]|nr:hypothetical protein [Deinococcales bacterium]